MGEWKVYAINEYEFFMARSMEEAKATAAEQWGYTVAQAEAEGLFDDADELADESLDRITLIDDTELPDGPLKKTTFRARLEKIVASDPRPQFFAGVDA